MGLLLEMVCYLCNFSKEVKSTQNKTKQKVFQEGFERYIISAFLPEKVGIFYTILKIICTVD